MSPSLPDEILVSILSRLPNVDCLKKAAVLSPTWLRCAHSACRQVLINEIGPRVLPDAIAALEASKCNAKDSHRVIEYSNKYLKTRPLMPATISLKDGAALAELHRSVSHLASEFHDFALRHLTKEQNELAYDHRDWPQPNPIDDEPSPAETARLHRALYRFDIYCSLFKDPEVIRFNLDAVDFQRAHFFNHLSPWETEQLVTMQDYLAANVIGPPLGLLLELRKHEAHLVHHLGPGNGQLVVSPNLDRGDSPVKQNQARLLCFGVNFLYKVSTTPDDQFYRLLLALPEQPQYASYNRVGEIYVWFSDAVDKSAELSNLDLPFHKPLESWTEKEYKEHVPKSLVTDDTNKGPEEAWYWAYKSFAGLTNNDPRMTNCRLFGLLFWDSERLQKVNFFTRVDFWWWRWESVRPPAFGIWGDLGDQF